jgi:hypothetical protein
LHIIGLLRRFCNIRKHTKFFNTYLKEMCDEALASPEVERKGSKNHASNESRKRSHLGSKRIKELYLSPPSKKKGVQLTGKSCVTGCA